MQSKIYPTAPPGLTFWGDPGVTRSGTTTPTKCFAPRVGLSYELTSDHKTVLRAGYGIYFNPNWANEAGQFAIYQPFTRRINLNTPPSTANPWANYPGGNPFPAQPSLGQIGYSPGTERHVRSKYNGVYLRARLQRTDDAAVEHQPPAGNCA